MGERIILCLACGQQNRLNAKARLNLARCGRCGQLLATPAKGIDANWRIPLVLASVAGLVGYALYSHQPSPSGSRHNLAASAEYQPPIRDHPRAPTAFGESDPYAGLLEFEPSQLRPQARGGSAQQGPEIPLPTLKPAMPDAIPTNPSAAELSRRGLTLEPARPVAISTGLVWVRPGRERIAPLEILTPSGYNYFVKLVNVADEQEEAKIYIEAGHSFTADVPLGTYEIHYAAGKVWYGEANRFGPDTVYYAADKRFTFYQQGNSVTGYTIELILQAGGNLSTTQIDPSQF